MAKYVRRDPFARGEYRRDCWPNGPCKWCGQQRKRVYSYTWIEDDKPRTQLSSETFCDLNCFDAYKGR